MPTPLRRSSNGSSPATLYFGVDPGASGGLACMAVYQASSSRPSGMIHGTEVDFSAMPPTRQDVLDWIGERIREHSSANPDIGLAPAYAVVEKVGGYVSSGGGKQKAGQPGSAMFKFGMSYERVLMALLVHKVSTDEAIPRTWQAAMGVAPRKKDESQTSFKNRLKARAQELFPSEKVTLAVCDALLLSAYCRRKVEGSLFVLELAKGGRKRK